MVEHRLVEPRDMGSNPFIPAQKIKGRVLMLKEYLFILVFLVIAIAISVAAFFLSFFLIKKDNYIEKNSAYECGFNPFADARHKFDVRFYLVAILFIIFDLEVIFLFPWAVSLRQIGPVGFWAMFVFLFILFVGFAYEWRKNALDWS